MKKLIVLTLMALLAAGSTYAQHPQQHCGRHHNCPHAQRTTSGPQVNADGIDLMIVKAFPTALLGYAVYSKPASDGIKGYNGETPVLIALTAKKKISGVYALPNSETPRFAQHVQESGFYDTWNGLSIKKALKKKVDTVSGATFTSRAVCQSVIAALEKL